jgi:pSer/pThr/pTyr-binding forkhead associated (FHA) protein
MALLGTALDNQNLLRALEVFLVALVWLFFFRVIRAVWVEVRPPKARLATPDVQVGLPQPGPRREKSKGRGRRGTLRLTVVEPEAQRGESFELADELTVGRAPGCGVRVEDAYTSNLHARLYRRDGSLWLEDLGSTNGTWVNGERVDGATRLSRGDVLQVGATVFEVTR